MRYANNSNYKKDTMIRKEGASLAPASATRVGRLRCLVFEDVVLMCAVVVHVSDSTLKELKRIIEESEIMRCTRRLSMTESP